MKFFIFLFSIMVLVSGCREPDCVQPVSESEACYNCAFYSLDIDENLFYYNVPADDTLQCNSLIGWAQTPYLVDSRLSNHRYIVVSNDPVKGLELCKQPK